MKNPDDITLCSVCKAELPGFNHESAVKEFKEVFGYPPKDTDLNACCDDCWAKAMAMMNRDMANQ